MKMGDIVSRDATEFGVHRGRAVRRRGNRN
jgi:hypothetical protein